MAAVVAVCSPTIKFHWIEDDQPNLDQDYLKHMVIFGPIRLGKILECWENIFRCQRRCRLFVGCQGCTLYKEWSDH